MPLDTRELAASTPKTELHLHLDGSLPASFIIERAAARGIECPADAEGVRKMLHDMKIAARRQDPSNAQTLGGNWGVFDYCNQFLQTADELEQAAAAVCTECHRQRVVYVELRFCPALHIAEQSRAEQSI